MEQNFECACCGEGIDIFIDLDEGDVQEFSVECAVCGKTNAVEATFDYPSSSYLLDTFHESIG